MPAEDVVALHIAPAVVAEGALTAREADRLRPVPREGRRDVVRRAGGPIPVGLDAVTIPTGGDVHVHIDRIDVHREAPPQPAPAVAQPKTDHAAYLARQAARWGS